jgi:hypothetical protein
MPLNDKKVKTHFIIRWSLDENIEKKLNYDLTYAKEAA